MLIIRIIWITIRIFNINNVILYHKVKNTWKWRYWTIQSHFGLNRIEKLHKSIGSDIYPNLTSTVNNNIGSIIKENINVNGNNNENNDTNTKTKTKTNTTPHGNGINVKNAIYEVNSNLVSIMDNVISGGAIIDKIDENGLKLYSIY